MHDAASSGLAVLARKRFVAWTGGEQKRVEAPILPVREAEVFAAHLFSSLISASPNGSMRFRPTSRVQRCAYLR